MGTSLHTNIALQMCFGVLILQSPWGWSVCRFVMTHFAYLLNFDWLINWLIDWLIDWFNDRSIGWLVWLIGWLFTSAWIPGVAYHLSLKAQSKISITNRTSSNLSFKTNFEMFFHWVQHIYKLNRSFRTNNALFERVNSMTFNLLRFDRVWPELHYRANYWLYSTAAV